MQSMKRSTGHSGAFVSRTILACASVGLLAGCATANSHLVDSWVDPSIQNDPMHKVVVIAVKKDPTQRRQWEDAFVAELHDRHVEAVPSYTLSPAAIPDSATMAQTLAGGGFDGVVMVRQSRREDRKEYVPPETYVRRAGYVYNPFWGVYQPVYRQFTTPGYVENVKLLWYRTTVYDLRQHMQEVWSGATQTQNPTSAQSVRHDVAGLVVPAMEGQKVIA